MKVKELIQVMNDRGLDSILVAGGNPHLIEYVPVQWQYREYISEFHSTFGNVVLTKQGDLYIGTDTRYELAVKEHAKKNSCFYGMKQDRLNFDEELEWLSSLNYQVKNIAVMPETLSLAQYALLSNKAHSLNIEPILVENLVEKVWESPELKQEKAFSVGDYDDRDTDEQVAKLRELNKQKGANATVITNLETIAIITKLRGYDIPNTPLLIAYMYVDEDRVVLFVDKAKLGSDMNLKGIEIEEYSYFETKIKELVKGKSVLIEESETTFYLYSILDGSADKLVFASGSQRKQKAYKTAYVLANMQKSAIKDGIALAELFYFVEKNISNLTEKDVADKLIQLKRENFDDFIMASFPSIVAYNENAAIIHYNTGTIKLRPEGILLLDSGSQYYTGTTDVTRTVALGPVSDEIKTMYTLVLKGHLEIARLKFTGGVSGKAFDLLARKHLFSRGYDYKHGTGHGVGYVSNVHETSGLGVSALADFPIELGMAFSNEPGYYKEGAYGIRIENVVGVIPSKYDTLDTYMGSNFLELMQLTMYPYDLRLVRRELLTSEEVEYINSYHREVFEKVSPYLGEEVKTWFKKQCGVLN